MGKTEGTSDADRKEARPEARKETREPGRRLANPNLAVGIAWLVPGAGHALLGRWGRAAIFFVLVLTCAAVGVALDGRLYTFDTAQRLLHWLAALGAFGLGLPYLLLDHALGYHGDPASATYEYGTAFLITASLMNCLLLLDVWDIARGFKD